MWYRMEIHPLSKEAIIHHRLDARSKRAFSANGGPFWDPYYRALDNLTMPVGQDTISKYGEQHALCGGYLKTKGDECVAVISSGTGRLRPGHHSQIQRDLDVAA